MPSNLSGIDNLHSGVGEGDDLLVTTYVSPDGSWYPELKPGFFYINEVESYLYARIGVGQVTWAANTVVSAAINLDYDPTLLGPVRMTRLSDGSILRRISSPLLPFQQCSLATSGAYKTAPVTGVLISVVSDPASGAYLGVGSLTDIYSRNDYYYDIANSRLFIADDNPPLVFSTSVVSPVQASMLRQREIIRVDKDGKIRVQLSPIAAASGVVVLKPTAAAAITVTTGMTVTDNVITLPSGYAITSGDLVAVSYYVADTFCTDYRNGILTVSGLVTTSGAYRIEYETSSSNYRVSELAPYHLSRIDLNPILTEHEAGYLYLCDEDLAVNTPEYLNIKAESENLVYSSWYSQPFLLEFEVLDKNLDPVPRQNISVSGNIAGYPTYNSLVTTNWQGKANILIRPTSPGQLTLIVSVVGSVLSKTYSVTVQNLEANLDAIANSGKLLITLSDTLDNQNRVSLAAQIMKIDGVPYQEGDIEVRTTPSHYEVTFSCGNSEILLADGRNAGNTATVVTDGYGVCSVYVNVKAGDILRASTNILGTTIYSNTIRIPEDTSSDATLESAVII